MKKTNQKRVWKTHRSMAFFLAVLMILAVLPVSCGIADDECNHIRKKKNLFGQSEWLEESAISYKYVNDSVHVKYCTLCGKEFETEKHDTMGASVQNAGSAGHKFYCWVCKEDYTVPHVIESNGKCFCGYVSENIPVSSGDSSDTATGTEQSTSEQPSGSGNSSQSTENKTNTNYKSDTSFTLPEKADNDAYECNYVNNGESQTVLIQIFGLCRCYVFIDGVPTYVFTSDLELADGVPQEQRLVYIMSGSHARLYKEPDFRNSIGLVSPGTILPVLSVGDVYIEVQYKGKTGYLKKSSCQLSAPVNGMGTGVIDNGKQAVNIRLKKDTRSAIVGTSKTGTEITILSEGGNWYEVECFGLHGYIRKEFVKFKEKGFGEQSASGEKLPEDGGQIRPPQNEDDPNEETYSIGEAVKDGVNLREKASKNSGLVHSMRKGDRAEILGEQTGKDGRTWYSCSVDGKEGYIRSDMLKIVEKDIPRERTDETVQSDEEKDQQPQGEPAEAAAAQSLSDEGWKKAYYEYLVGGGFQYRKTPREENDWTYWTDRFGVEYCMDAVDADGVMSSVKFALYDWDQDGIPELLSYDAGSAKGIGDYHAYTYRNGQMGYFGRIGTGYSAGIAPYRDATHNVIFSSFTSGYSTEVFYAFLDSQNNAKLEMLIETEYIDTGDDQPGEWEITDGPADQELYDLFLARYGRELDYFFTDMPFKEVTESADDAWWNDFVNNCLYVLRD